MLRCRTIGMRMLCLFAMVLISPHLAPSVLAQDRAVSRQVVDYPSGSLHLRGILFTPAGAGPHPAVVFLHGAAGAADEAVTLVGNTFSRHGYTLFFPFRRGLGLSAGQGKPISATLQEDEDLHGEASRRRLTAKLLETEQLDDVHAAIEYLRSRSDVDSSRVAVFGTSMGGILAVLTAERITGIKASISAATGAQNWAQGPELRKMLLMSVQNAVVPVFFFQAANDYDLSPTEQLASEMARVGKPHLRKIYPAFGSSHGEGHTIATQAPQLWQDDVFGFLEQQLQPSSGNRPRPAAR